ncbi:MAG TPA: cyclic nucleotide-binding domain-containing protein [Candidatus Eisenbacteria bacterium]
MESLEAVVAKVALFQGMKRDHIALLSGCAADVRYEAGAYPSRAGTHSDRFWVVREGRLALELWAPGRGSITVATMTPGDVVGFSWLVPPYQTQFDVHAVAPTRALLFDGRALRERCERDPELGYHLMSRFSGLMVDRILVLTMQLLDIYGDHPVEQS